MYSSGQKKFLLHLHCMAFKHWVFNQLNNNATAMLSWCNYVDAAFKHMVIAEMSNSYMASWPLTKTWIEDDQPTYM